MHCIAPSCKHTASFLSECFVQSIFMMRSKGCMRQVTKGPTNLLHPVLKLVQSTRKKEETVDCSSKQQYNHCKHSLLSRFCFYNSTAGGK